MRPRTRSAALLAPALTALLSVTVLSGCAGQGSTPSASPLATGGPSGVAPARLGGAQAGDLSIDGAAVVRRPGGAAVLLHIANTGRATASDDVLTGIGSNFGDTRLAPGRVPVASGASVQLVRSPGQPSATLPAGADLIAQETCALTLHFLHAGDVPVFATIQ